MLPHPCITFNLGVRSDKNAVEPGIALTTKGIRFVFEAIVSRDLGARRIGSANLALSVHQPVRLKKIDGFFHVGGNDLVILADR